MYSQYRVWARLLVPPYLLFDMPQPLIGITTDYVETPRPVAQSAIAYAQSVRAAGGIPVLLPPITELAAEHAAVCDGFVFTGGGDVLMERFGETTHKEAKTVHPKRQKYELSLLDELRNRTKPVLGICLGMQYMSLHAGAKFNQHLPETHATASIHRGQEHEIIPSEGGSGKRLLPTLLRGNSASNHHQAVREAGPLEVLAMSPDGVIEAVADPKHPFYVGVQWHPERTSDPNLGLGIFKSLLAAIRGGA